MPTNAPEPRQHPDLELVTVFECEIPVALALAKATLEEAGIPCLVEGEEIARRAAEAASLIHRWRRIQVTRDREAEDRALLSPIEEINSPIRPDRQK